MRFLTVRGEDEGSEVICRVWQVSAVNQSVEFSRLYSGQMGAVRGTKTSQEHRCSAQRCLMSFRWEVNHNREQRTPERAVLRKCCAAQQPLQGKQTAKSAVQPICAADHSGLDRSGFLKLEQFG